MNRSIIDADWIGLDSVSSCPYCGGTDRQLLCAEVQDWTFYSAPGKWNYWECGRCCALYLDPRPSALTIGAAYSRYYTHVPGFFQIVKRLVINETLSHNLGVSIRPRLYLPRFWRRLLRRFEAKAVAPFEITELALLPRGRVLDVGCGDGSTILLAKLLGFTVSGFDMDPGAVRAAVERGLDVVVGDFDALGNDFSDYDYIICSHVLEHVFDPLRLLSGIFSALKPGGVAFISCPNSQSSVRQVFGRYWRGLEAPRHLCIPSRDSLVAKLQNLGFVVSDVFLSRPFTVSASEKIALEVAGSVPAWSDAVSTGVSAVADFIQLRCVKPLG